MTVPADEDNAPPTRMDDRSTPPDPQDRSDTIEAFSAFYREFIALLVAFLVWQGARLPDAADIAQETMLKAYQQWSKINHPKAWARRAASREFARRIAAVPEDPCPDPPECSLLPPKTDVEEWEQRHWVQRLLDRLPPRQRQVMAWTLEGCAPAEIAAELGITAQAVRASLMKARRALAGYLGEAGEK